MKICFRLTLFFCLILSAFSKLSFAEFVEKIPACRVVYEGAKKQALKDLADLEIFYEHYRAAEFKIRTLEYFELWQARHDGSDPISKEVRSRGQQAEERLLKELELLDNDSKQASNDLIQGFEKFQSVHMIFYPCCEDPDIRSCIEKALQPLYDRVKEGVDYFDHIFEHEREYRTAVELTIGGRKGLYPLDTVEPAVLHKDYFARFEVERRQARFEEDVWMIAFFQSLREKLLNSFPGDDCCLHCGKTNWEQKTEKLFRES